MRSIVLPLAIALAWSTYLVSTAEAQQGIRPTQQRRSNNNNNYRARQLQQQRQRQMQQQRQRAMQQQRQIIQQQQRAMQRLQQQQNANKNPGQGGTPNKGGLPDPNAGSRNPGQNPNNGGRPNPNNPPKGGAEVTLLLGDEEMIKVSWASEKAKGVQYDDKGEVIPNKPGDLAATVENLKVNQAVTVHLVKNVAKEGDDPKYAPAGQATGTLTKVNGGASINLKFNGPANGDGAGLIVNKIVINQDAPPDPKGGGKKK